MSVGPIDGDVMSAEVSGWAEPIGCGSKRLMNHWWYWDDSGAVGAAPYLVRFQLHVRVRRILPGGSATHAPFVAQREERACDSISDQALA